MDQNMRTTSHGGAFKKVHQSKSGLNSRLESPLLYQDEMEVTEIHNFDNTERLNMLEPNRIGYNQQEPQGMISVANQQKR
jgi:serine/threonine protein kinase